MIRYTPQNLELKKKLNEKHKLLTLKVNYIRRLKYRLASMLLSEKDDKRYDKLIEEVKNELEKE